MTGVFDGLSVNLGIKMSDIFAGVAVFAGQFWPLIALGVAVPLAFGIGRRLMNLGKKSA